MSMQGPENSDGQSTAFARPADPERSGQVCSRAPIHVVYGGAHLFRADTVRKLGRLALEALNSHAANFVEFAQALHIHGAESFPYDSESIRSLEEKLAKNPEASRTEEPAAWLAWQVFRRTREKLEREPVEDFRIDFEDGYGVRSDEEEDLHAALSANELARSIGDGSCSANFGIRVKSLAHGSAERALRTLDIFVHGLFETAGPEFASRFTVTLPKISRPAEVKRLANRLKKLERKTGVKKGSIGIEVMIETPAAIFNDNGKPMARKIVKAAAGRCHSAHFGAYDYTSALGISARDQDLRHPGCEFARQVLLLSLSPLGIRLSDSVTTQIPAPLHRGEDLTPHQIRENQHAVHAAWQAHFDNILYSMSNGFYQSWDLHPAQLVARFAAVNYFFLDRFDEQARRMRSYIENSAQATLTGASFDDAASVRGLAAFFERGIGCGALTEAEVRAAIGLSATDIQGLFDENKSAARDEQRHMSAKA